ncbi:hypothetical protein [Streptomyces nanshensis]|uniref:Uncharacterized protein n=1 Tax=Streptomyces nanshensis TaxID=518642 RepID=A0A1E7LAE7_9ACTN|nr:hypothetical protein [Streptomyces nanshensis]OEV13215.1 hypothetical protein AN218_04700 [Streptomyces nanshensis]
MLSIETILDFKFNDLARSFADTHGYGGGLYGTHGMDEMRDDAEELTVARGFGLISGDAMDQPLPAAPGGFFYGHECERIRYQANAETVTAGFERIGVECWEWRGYIAFDASSAKGRKLAEEYGDALAAYPILDEERVSELEHEAACHLVEQEIRLPDGVNAEDVLSELPETPYCADCGTGDLTDAMDKLGYTQCADCEEWLKTETTGALCYDCADAYSEPDCECVSTYVDTMRHLSTHVDTTRLPLRLLSSSYPTESDVREIQRGCENCYPAIYPYAVAA